MRLNKVTTERIFMGKRTMQNGIVQIENDKESVNFEDT